MNVCTIYVLIKVINLKIEEMWKNDRRLIMKLTQMLDVLPVEKLNVNVNDKRRDRQKD